MTVFSFHPVKIVTAGEGGALVTNNDEHARRARELRSHGMIRDPNRFQGLGSEDLGEFGPWYYEMQELGFNFRITDVQCALALSQLQRLAEFTSRRREIVAKYNSAFCDLPHVKIPGLRNPNDRALTSWHLYTLLIEFDAVGLSRSEFMQRLRDRGVGSQVLYIPVHLQPWYRGRFGYGPGKCPNAEHFYEQTLSLPLYPAMTEQDVNLVIETVTNTLSET